MRDSSIWTLSSPFFPSWTAGTTLKTLHLANVLHLRAFTIHKINRKHFPIQHQPIGIYKGNTLCSLWGRNWTFTKYTTLSLHFIINHSVEISRSLLSVINPYCSNAFIITLLLTEGRAGDIWNPLKIKYVFLLPLFPLLFTLILLLGLLLSDCRYAIINFLDLFSVS
jgi:hypothetical protein